MTGSVATELQASEIISARIVACTCIPVGLQEAYGNESNDDSNNKGKRHTPADRVRSCECRPGGKGV